MRANSVAQASRLWFRSVHRRPGCDFGLFTGVPPVGLWSICTGYLCTSPSRLCVKILILRACLAVARRRRSSVTKIVGARHRPCPSCLGGDGAPPLRCRSAFSSYSGEPRDSAEGAMTLREGGRLMNDCGAPFRLHSHSIHTIVLPPISAAFSEHAFKKCNTELTPCW